MESNTTNTAPGSSGNVSTEGTGSESGVTPKEGFTDLANATDEQLSAFLNSDAAAVTESGEVVTTDKEPDANTKDEGKPDANAAEAKPQADSQAQVDPEYIKKLETIRVQQEAFIQRQQTEYGEMKKRLGNYKLEIAEKNAQIQKMLENQEVLDPSKIVDYKLEIQKNQQTLEALDQEETNQDVQFEASMAVKRNFDVVQKNVKPDEWNMDAIAQTLQGDGVPPQVIQQFIANPYAATDGLTLVQLAKRAKAENAVRQLAKYVLTLREQIELEKKKPQALLRNVQKNLSESKTLTNAGGNGGANKGMSVDVNQLSGMSDEELKAIIEQNA